MKRADKSTSINLEPFIPLLKHYKVFFAIAILQTLIDFYQPSTLNNQLST